jgi:hypothetical protein
MPSFMWMVIINHFAADCSLLPAIFQDFCHHHRQSVMGLGLLLTRSGLTCPEVSSKVCHNSFCQLGNSVSLLWVIYYEAFYLHVVQDFCLGIIFTFSSQMVIIKTINWILWVKFLSVKTGNGKFVRVLAMKVYRGVELQVHFLSWALVVGEGLTHSHSRFTRVSHLLHCCT